MAINAALCTCFELPRQDATIWSKIELSIITIKTKQRKLRAPFDKQLNYVLIQ